MKRIAAFAFFILLFSILVAVAQGPPPTPTPAPELKKLDYFVGNWKTTGDIKPGPMGPGGKFSSVDHNEWMPGRFFLILHSTGGGAMGHFIETAYMGYSTEDKAYTYDAFNNMGEAEHSKGTAEGDTWTWTSTEKIGGKTMKGRFTLTIVSPTAYNMKFEIAPEGGDYSTVMEGKATKVVAAKAKGAEGGAAKK